MMRNRVLTAVAAVSLVTVQGEAWAQDRGALQAQAKSALAQFRAAGEPKDRCSMNAWVADGGVVIRAMPGSALMAGDQLLALNAKAVEGARAEEIVAHLRTAGPSAKVPLKIRRAGAETALDLQCSNARPVTQVLFSALERAAAGKFDDCILALGDTEGLGTSGALLKAQCAAASKKSGSYDQPRFSFDALRLQLEDARWNVSERAGLIDRLRGAEGFITQGLGASKYRELAAITRTWPGGEELYDASAPDFALFKRNGEAALKARLIDPESARIEWHHGFTYGAWKPLFSKSIDGYWTCGAINARNRMGGYTGASAFVVVLDPKGGVRYVEVGQNRDFDLLAEQCANSAKHLPPAPPETASTSAPSASGGSLADELKKLSDLRSSGVLTEAEFEAAKKRLLSQ